MSRVLATVKLWTGRGSNPVGGLSWLCPGCGDIHSVSLKVNENSTIIPWNWNADLIRPTISPSVLIKTGHYGQGLNHQSWDCHCTQRHPKQQCYICHFNVSNGIVHFYPDSTHALAGKAIHLPTIDQWV